MTNKLIWEGEPSAFHINSSEDFGYVNRHSGRETVDNGDGTFTCNELFDEFLLGFHGDIILFSEDDFFMGQVESTCEYYDYDAHFYHVIKVEQRECGDLEITVNYRTSTPTTNTPKGDLRDGQPNMARSRADSPGIDVRGSASTVKKDV